MQCPCLEGEKNPDRNGLIFLLLPCGRRRYFDWDPANLPKLGIGTGDITATKLYLGSAPLSFPATLWLRMEVSNQPTKRNIQIWGAREERAPTPRRTAWTAQGLVDGISAQISAGDNWWRLGHVVVQYGDWGVAQIYSGEELKKNQEDLGGDSLMKGEMKRTTVWIGYRCCMFTDASFGIHC